MTSIRSKHNTIEPNTFLEKIKEVEDSRSIISEKEDNEKEENLSMFYKKQNFFKETNKYLKTEGIYI